MVGKQGIDYQDMSNSHKRDLEMSGTPGGPRNLGKTRIRLPARKINPRSHSGRKADRLMFESRNSPPPNTATSLHIVEVILAGTGVALVDAGVREGKKARRVEKESRRGGRRNVKGGMGQRRRKVGPKGTGGRGERRGGH